MVPSRFLGGVLLIVGTSIGGGMLALPVSLAAVGMVHSIIFLIICWLIMTAGAFLILEVNLRLPPGTNMVSMARETLGVPGACVTWLICLCLLYSLLAAYISGGSDVLHGILYQAHIALPHWMTSMIFTAAFSMIIYQGIKVVDYVNRVFMFGKLGTYILLVAIISPYVQTKNLTLGSWSAIQSSLMILITSFGFASIVPSLRYYLADDIPLLRRVIFYGSLIPLLCYVIWIFVIMGVVASDDPQGLMALIHTDHVTSGLTNALNNAIHHSWISGFFAFFTAICMVTAFLGVSLGLFDFLADGLKLQKKGQEGIWVLMATFLPSLLVVLICPGIYLNALQYAGICCVIFLLLLPTLMTWKARKMGGATHLIPGGNVVLTIMLCIAIGLLTIAI
ncbi:MAG TPA: aromatic amino acid transport family protein [Legionellaceae bacterium]|nr:aromatic amino acid transport family protein [Legionellaceae bacterium]